jgi:hypothetical protein
MYEYQKKQISKIAKLTAEYLSQHVDPQENPETDPTKIEACMISAVKNMAELFKISFGKRQPTTEEKTKAIKGFLTALLSMSHVWRCGYQDHEAELIEIVNDELSERRREAIRDSFRDIWEDDTSPETIDGERQQNLINAYRSER